MVDVKVTDRAYSQIEGLPLPVQGRLEKIVARLEHWPEVTPTLQKFGIVICVGRRN